MVMKHSAFELQPPAAGSARRGGGDYVSQVNVGQGERWASVLAGAALAVYGITRASWPGLALAVLGGTLVYRGASGNCQIYSALDIDRAHPGGVRQGNLGVKVDQAVLINAPADRLFRFWRNLENLPRIMSNVDSVRAEGPNRSHWVVRGPAGKQFEWDAEIINEVPNEIIAWRSVGHPDVEHAGSVRFEVADDGATIVRVSLQYDPPAGVIGHVIAASTWIGDAGQRIDEDLTNFKQAVESGRIAA